MQKGEEGGRSEGRHMKEKGEYHVVMTQPHTSRASHKLHVTSAQKVAHALHGLAIECGLGHDAAVDEGEDLLRCPPPPPPFFSQPLRAQGQERDREKR